VRHPLVCVCAVASQTFAEGLDAVPRIFPAKQKESREFLFITSAPRNRNCAGDPTNRTRDSPILPFGLNTARFVGKEWRTSRP